MTDASHPTSPQAVQHLKLGAGVLLFAFWAIHLVTMLIRAEINDTADQLSFLDNFTRRASFALFGALLGYVLYRCLRPLRRRPFLAQVTIGAALALITALVQAYGNTLIFESSHTRYYANLLYALLYWFWFYFCWTTAYLAFAYSITVQEQERRAAELSAIAQEAQVRALRYQISPHFLFNTLNAIAALVREAPAQAERMVLQLSDFFRRTLAVNPLEDLTLAEEVELQRLYLEIERTRFPDRLRFDVALAEGTAEARIPALLLQPLVENAVKHGVARAEAATCIRIAARVEGDTLKIVVEDDAAAASAPVSGERVGLRNVEQRLHSRFGADAALTISARSPTGFRNLLRVPLVR